MSSKTKMISLFALASVLLCELPGGNISSAFADEKSQSKLIQPSQPIARRFRRNLPRNHDRGALFRFSLGGGYAKISSNTGTNAFEASGLAGFPSLAVGWLPYEQLGLHVSGWGVLGGDTTAGGFGPGVTYYFDARSNTWISGAIGPFVLEDLESDGIQWSLGGEFEAGLYGWIGQRWSMGASLFGGLSGFDLDVDSIRPWAWSAGIRLGVVYN